MNAAILYSTFLDHGGTKLRIGGIETYLFNLARVCEGLGIQPRIYQWGDRPFKATVDGIQVIGIPTTHLRYRSRPRSLFTAALKELDIDRDIIIFGSDQQAVRSQWKRVISIQHGISWDLPARLLTRHRLCQSGGIGRLYKTWLQRQFIDYFERCLNRVCVDHNFLNWYRTHLVAELKGRNWVIPNFSRIASEERVSARKHGRRTTAILFARRFCEYRGTRIMAAATRNLLARHENVTFTFAGEGPDEEWLREYFVDEQRVHFGSYKASDAMNVHLRHDIAVVPSLGSEGTSLSVVEAMATGCAVITTAVGGIPNMIIDGYNGLLVSPNESELFAAMDRLICNTQLRDRLAASAYSVAVEAFSLDAWRRRWSAVIREIAAE